MAGVGHGKEEDRVGALLCLGIPNWEEDPRRRGKAEGHSTALPCVLTLKEEGLGAIIILAQWEFSVVELLITLGKIPCKSLQSLKQHCIFYLSAFTFRLVAYVCANLSLNLNARLERRVRTYRCL